MSDIDGALAAAAEEVLAVRGRKQQSWFAAQEEHILAACRQRNDAFRRWARAPRGCKAKQLLLSLRQARANVRAVVKSAAISWTKCSRSP